VLASTDIRLFLLARRDRRQALPASYFKLKVFRLVAGGQLHLTIVKRHVRKERMMAEDTAIEVVLQRSGLTFMVPPNKSILQVLIDEGIDPLYDCQRGECGICQVAVLEGVPDHRDHILSDDERAGNKVMQICVSRAKTPRLVIDL
jgi:ferredoxin